MRNVKKRGALNLYYPPYNPMKGAGRRQHQQLLIQTGNYNGRYSSDLIQHHLPGLFEHMRESGNRRVAPVRLFESSFSNVKDYDVFDTAMEWIMTRLELYLRGRGQLGPFQPFPDDKNRLFDIKDKLEMEFDYFYRTGDDSMIEPSLQYILHLFQMIGHILECDQGCGASGILHAEFVNTALQFVPYFSSDPSSMMSLITAVSKISGYNNGVMERLVNQLGPYERRDLRDTAYAMFKKGDLVATQLLYHVI
ncbi:hypothetical protein B7494_g7169 [Chlorociboria aeruginascens]|nr:hypothetical protein B7494_g7169 [Chlorociboria aeruginascens]